MLDEKLKKVKILAMDVDGTLTDGSIYISGNGEAMKRFDVKDGLGISLLHETGMITAIITGRNSAIVSERAKELKISEVMQGVSQKDLAIQELAKKYGITEQEIAYIGDDLNDLPALICCGVSICPADAVDDVREKCDIVLEHAGGHGAVREIAEILLRQNAGSKKIIERKYNLYQ